MESTFFCNVGATVGDHWRASSGYCLLDKFSFMLRLLFFLSELLQ